jgi:hypothetical protein
LDEAAFAEPDTGRPPDELTAAGMDSFCESRKSVILAFVLGVAGPGRAQAALEHLDSCPSCTHWAAEVREANRQQHQGGSASSRFESGHVPRSRT